MKAWIQILWMAMQKTGNGYHRPSLRHTGEGDDRRNDKLTEGVNEKGVTVMVPFDYPESKIQRQARLGLIGVRK